jgi:polygalacturonase
MLVDLDKPLSRQVQAGDCLENITWTPSLTVSHCRFGGTLTRGLLVTTRRPVLIEDNTFFRTGMCAILISSDAGAWFESGPVQDVTIRRNVFQECAYRAAPDDYIIMVKPETPAPARNYWIHRNIRIENNTFRVFDRPVLLARSTSGLTFEHNDIIHSSFMQPQQKVRPAFRLTACTKVRIKDNRFDPPETPQIKLEGMDKRDIEIGSGQVSEVK